MSRPVLAALVVATMLLTACGPFGPERWREVPTPWAIDSIDGATLTLQVQVGSSTCDRNPRIAEVEEQDAFVRISAVRETLTNPRACTMDLGFATMVVELAEPLGDRALEGCWPDGRDLPCPTADF
jgi:hypothetical protein